jgi:hypothetical protein
MFDSPEALATRQAALAAALPETLVRPLGPVLLLWRPIVGASTPSKPFSVAEQRRLSAARMGALLRSAGERYVEGSVLSVECDAPGPSEAEAVRSTLATYADDSMKWAASGWDDPAWNAGGAPIPPWADDPSPNAANPAPHRLSIFPSRDLARVRIQLSLGVDSIESDVNPLLRWLCARSCVNTRVVLDAYR